LFARRISLSKVSVGVAVGVTEGDGLVEGVATGDEQLDKVRAAIVRTNNDILLRCPMTLPLLSWGNYDMRHV
jgi:hypothetical protein